MFKFFFFILFALAGRALAFNVVVGSTTFQANEMMAIPAQDVAAQASNVTAVQQAIASCSSSAGCLCESTLVNNLRSAQQCMFEDLIARNVKSPDLRVGSNVLMTAFSTSCTNENATLPLNITVALTVPPNFDGPFDAILPMGGTVLTVAAGAMLGIFFLLLLSNLS